MKIPDFLRPGSSNPLPEDIEMERLIREYKNVIGDDLITEPSTYNTHEWINILSECIEKKITIWELLGEKYDPKADY